MTTPDRSGRPEEVGLVEIYGIPPSTFTRSIKLGLHELGIHFVQVEREPHSKDVKARNKYGLLPILVHRPDGLHSRDEDLVTLHESNAIRRYIDEYLAPIAASSPKAGTHNLQYLTPQPASRSASGLDQATIIDRARVDGFVSTFSQTIFPALEHAFIKPAGTMQNNGADKQTILVALDQSVQRVHSLLQIVEEQASSSSSASGKDGPWIAGGDQLTWADLFLYPILDDLRVSPLGDLVQGESPTFPWLAQWMQRMDARSSVKNTYPGTVAHQATRK